MQRIRKVFSFFWRLFLVIALVAATAPIAPASNDIHVSGASYYVTLANAVPWNQLSGNYIFTPQSPNVGICLFVENLNTTSSHAITITAFQSGNPSLSTYQATPNLWAPSTINGSITSVPAQSVKSEYINIVGAANVAIVVAGTAPAAGSPDVANFFAVQTTVQNCGSSPPAAFVQGDVANGSSVAGINPVLICGVSSGACRQIAVDGSGGLLLSSFSTPGDDTISTQGVLGLANTSVAYGLMTSPIQWDSSGRNLRFRAVDQFNAVSASAAGNTAVWNPGAGKNFRLLCVSVEVTGNAAMAAAGEETITFQDGATTIPGFLFDSFVPAAALNTHGQLYTSGMVCVNGGYLSIASANVLSVNLSTALTSGHVIVRAWGVNN